MRPGYREESPSGTGIQPPSGLPAAGAIRIMRGSIFPAVAG
jgi:hypothetical protein